MRPCQSIKPDNTSFRRKLDFGSWPIASFRRHAMIPRLSKAARTRASHRRGRVYEFRPWRKVRFNPVGARSVRRGSAPSGSASGRRDPGYMVSARRPIRRRRAEPHSCCPRCRRRSARGKQRAGETGERGAVHVAGKIHVGEQNVDRQPTTQAAQRMTQGGP